MDELDPQFIDELLNSGCVTVEEAGEEQNLTLLQQRQHAPYSEPLLPTRFDSFQAQQLINTTASSSQMGDNDTQYFLTPLMSPAMTPTPQFTDMSIDDSQMYASMLNTASRQQLQLPQQRQLSREAMTPASIMNVTLQTQHHGSRSASPRTSAASGEPLFHAPHHQSAVDQNNAMRKSNHKVAEQRRRDAIKRNFDSIRQLLPNLGAEKNPSKLFLLERTHEYLLQVQSHERRLVQEVQHLRAMVVSQQQQIQVKSQASSQATRQSGQ